MEATTTTLVSGFNHVAVVVRDLDRWVEFWTGVFGTSFEEIPDERGRHGFLALDADTTAVLHALEAPAEVTGGDFPNEGMFRRGRLDHLGVGVVDEAALLVIRDRLVARGASDGSLRLFGPVLSILAVDPEGMAFEVCCFRTGDVIADGEYEIGH
ncbi:MAG TPA: VOC family protein [Acidimicrobiia bacterium]|jgi:catechol 2,3-dioxygenase-like lactoylglutathione lyase family enzyme|nr:VOC family protein [Acidimicrobiia bacterium]